MSQPASQKTIQKRVVVAACFGTFLEWYDFLTFASLAVYFSVLFFPADDPVAALLASLGTFGIGMIVRPLGAALFSQKAARVREVCNQGYGTLALLEEADTGRVRYANSIVIPKNTPIPCSMSQTYLTSEDNEELIEVEITQGDDPDPRYVDIVGKISLRVPPGRPAGCAVTVTYSYDENQRVRAQIYDEESGLRKDIAIVSQDPVIFSANALENIRYGRATASDDEVMQAARAAQVDEFS